MAESDPGPGRPSRRPLVLILTAVVIVLALGTAGAVVAITQPWTGTAPDSTPHPTATRASSPDLLKPTSEVLVGKERWVSPCRALSRDEAERIFGRFPDFSTTRETYLDHTVPVHELSLPVESTCARGVPGEDPTVEVAVTAYAQDENTGSVANDLALDADEYRAQLERVTDVQPRTKAGRELVKRMRGSVARVRRADSYEGDFGDLSGVVVAASGIGAPKGAGQEIRGVVGTTGFSVTWRGAASEKSSVADRIDRMAAAYALVRTRIGDESLSQSPEPTVLGTDLRVGGTRIQEPCALLTPDLFTTVTGLPPNDQNEREGIRWDPEKTRRSVRTGKPVAPSNACTRNYDADVLPVDDDLDPVFDAPAEAALAAGYANVRLELSYYGSAARAKAAWAASFEPEGDFVVTPLDTTADDAKVASSAALDYSGYSFLEGGMIGRITVSLQATGGGLSDSIDDVAVPSAYYPALIDGVVAGIAESGSR